MNQKSRSAVYIAAQETETFIGGVPGFNHDVIQLITQKVFDDALKARLNLQKVCQNADRSESALHHSGLEKATHRFGGIAMLRNDRLQRSFLSKSRGKFGA